MARITNKHARTKPHRLFEDSKHVSVVETASILDESLWSSADTLNDDEHDASSYAQMPHGRNSPQVSDQSDLNPDPASEDKQQDIQQGERSRGNVNNPGGGIGDHYDSYPRPGDDWVGRHRQLRNFPSERDTEDTVGTGSSQVNAQFSKNGFDYFVNVVGDNDVIEESKLRAIDNALLVALKNIGVLSEPTYNVNKSVLRKIVDHYKQQGRDLSSVTIDELSQFGEQGAQAPQQGGFQTTQPVSQPAHQQPQQIQPEQTQPVHQSEEPEEELRLVEEDEFDLSKIPTISKKKLVDIGREIGELTGRGEELLNHLVDVDRDITVKQFLTLDYSDLPQPKSPAELAAEEVEEKRGPYEEPMLTAQIHIPEESDPDLFTDEDGPVPLQVPPLESGEGSYPFTEEDLYNAKKEVYERAVTLEVGADEEDEVEELATVEDSADEGAEEATEPLTEQVGDAPPRADQDDFETGEEGQQTQQTSQPPVASPVQRPLNAPQKQLINQHLDVIRSEYPDADLPDVESFGSWEDFENWYRQQSTQLRHSIRLAMKKMGVNMPKIMTIDDVRRVSPRHAQKMERHGIEWVDQDAFMDRLASDTARVVEANQNPVKMVHALRREGKSFNHINRELVGGFASGFYDSISRDVGHVAAHRLAQRTVRGTFNLTSEKLKQDVDRYIDYMSAKSEVTPKSYVKKAARQIRATDYTLYNLSADKDKDDFNYADPWDVEWTLFRQTEGGKRGAKLDVMKSPSCAIMVATDHGDGNYLVRGLSMLDEAYWGTYTIKVEGGLVTQYAKLPVDKEGKRFASNKEPSDAVRTASRRKYVALYRALCRLGVVAQMSDLEPGWDDFPESDEEIEERVRQIQEWQEKQKVRDKELEEKIKKMNPKLYDVGERGGEFPSQEEADKAYYEGLKKMLEQEKGNNHEG